VLDDDFDNVRDERTNHPLGVSWWTDVLYFGLGTAPSSRRAGSRSLAGGRVAAGSHSIDPER
jgi:hypothetical protein